MKKINRHIKAGAISVLAPMVIIVSFFSSVTDISSTLGMVLPYLIGIIFAGVLNGAIIFGIEKMISKQLWLILSIIPGLVLGGSTYILFALYLQG